jgi:two-component system response regulator HydG
MTQAVRKVFLAYSWPGNVRELKNTIESMVVIDVDGRLDMDDLTEDLQSTALDGKSDGAGGIDSLVGKSIEEIEKHYIAETLKQTSGNREEAARMLGIGERTLYRKLKEYQLA